MEELYGSARVTVTRSRITVGGTDYPVGNISAVAVLETKLRSPLGPPLLIPGLLMSFAAFYVVAVLEVERPLLLVAIIVGAILALGGILALIVDNKRRRYDLVLETNSGRQTAYSTTDRDEMEAIRLAIRTALDDGRALDA